MVEVNATTVLSGSAGGGGWGGNSHLSGVGKETTELEVHSEGPGRVLRMSWSYSKKDMIIP